MNEVQGTPITPLTIGIIAAIVGLLAVSGVKVYGWIRAQVTIERKEWEARYDQEVASLRTEVNQLKIEVHDLQNGKAKALRHLGRALGATDLAVAKRLVDEAISALAPVS